MRDATAQPPQQFVAGEVDEARIQRAQTTRDGSGEETDGSGEVDNGSGEDEARSRVRVRDCASAGQRWLQRPPESKKKRGSRRREMRASR